MLQTLPTTRVESIVYTLIGAGGAVTSAEFGACLAENPFPSERWLRGQAEAGYLHRDDFGRYGTSCAWPRVGF